MFITSYHLSCGKSSLAVFCGLCHIFVCSTIYILAEFQEFMMVQITEMNQTRRGGKRIYTKYKNIIIYMLCTAEK